MKHLNLLLLCLSLVTTSCYTAGTGPEELIIEGRPPEVVTWVSGRQWVPSNIAMLIQKEENQSTISLEASSSANRGYKRTMQLLIHNSEFEFPLIDTLNLLETNSPVMVSVTYEQFRDRQNLYSSKWRGDTNDLGGISIDRLEEEDGITYATGNFFMNPYLFLSRPDVQEIEGLFNNVRVFQNKDSMQAYFDKLTAIEIASGR